MITAERVYEVFGIDPELKFLVGDECTSNVMTLISIAPEILVALVNIAVEMMPYNHKGFDNKGHCERITKAIESADSQNRKWPELLKELER